MRFATAVLSLAAAVAAGADEASDRAIVLARQALGRQLGPTSSGAVVIDATAVDWPDSSLGCRRSGFTYQPVVTPGHRVRLQLGGSIYTVHVGAGQAVVCSTQGNVDGDGRRQSPNSKDDRNRAADAATGLRLAKQARADLAARLAIPLERVTIELYRSAVWPDTALGCQRAGDTNVPQPTRGFRIQLLADGRRYEFHSDLVRVIACPPDAAGPRAR